MPFPRRCVSLSLHPKTVESGGSRNTRHPDQHADLTPQNPSIISSAGAIGKQFNPDGAIGSIGQAVGGPFSKDGVIGSQFDASKDGIAGHVERAVDGPSNPAGSGKKA